MLRRKRKRDPVVAAILGAAGILVGLGVTFLFASKKGEKYRTQMGEFAADFLDHMGDGFRNLRDTFLKLK